MKSFLSEISPILSFLDGIGLLYKLTEIDGQTFLPGLKLSEGILIIDINKLLYPGDILHEAGHLACMPPEIRQGMSDDLVPSDLHQGGEMMAIAGLTQPAFTLISILLWCSMKMDINQVAKTSLKIFNKDLLWEFHCCNGAV